MAGRSVHTLLTPPRRLPVPQCRAPTEGAIHTDTSWDLTPTSYANHRQAGSLHCTWPLRNGSVTAPQVNKLNTCGLKSILSSLLPDLPSHVTNADSSRYFTNNFWNPFHQCWKYFTKYLISEVCWSMPDFWSHFDSAGFLKPFQKWLISDIILLPFNSWFLRNVIILLTSRLLVISSVSEDSEVIFK